jgi:hypothetical protein
MKKLAFWLAVVLMLFNGISALTGGWLLMADPGGQKLPASMDFLRHTPSKNFLVPGVVLSTALGVFSMAALAAHLAHLPRSPLFELTEGVLLTGWIAVQLLWTQVYHPLQALIGTI